MSDKSYNERRKFPRYTHDLPVTYQTLAAEMGIQCPHCGGELVLAGRSLEQVLIQGTGRTQTLSLGGMSIEVDRSFAPGKQLLVQFPIRGELISVRSSVVLSHRSVIPGFFRMGLEFLDLSETFRQVLVDYFADNLLKEARDRNILSDISTDEVTDVLHGDLF